MKNSRLEMAEIANAILPDNTTGVNEFIAGYEPVYLYPTPFMVLKYFFPSFFLIFLM